MANDATMRIGVEMEPRLEGARAKFQEFGNRVRREFMGIQQDSSAMESLFFSPGGQVKTWDKSLRDMGSKFASFSRKMGSEFKKAVPPGVSKVFGEMGAAVKQLGQTVKQAAPTLAKARGVFGDIKKGYKAGKTRQADPFSAGLGLFSKERFGLRVGQKVGEARDWIKESAPYQAASKFGSAIGRGARAVGVPVAAEIKGFLTSLKDSTKTLQGWGKSLGATTKKMGGLAARGILGAGRMGWRGIRGAVGLAGRAAMGAAGGLMGLAAGGIMSAYTQGIQAYEGTQQARLQATTALGANARFIGGRTANQYGYRLNETAQMQAQAAREGIRLRGTGEENRLLQLNRALGPEGIQAAGGMMRRGGGNLETVFRRLSGIVAIGMATGLEKGRIGELLQASNEYAERQIAVTPDAKESARQFATMMARFQESGVSGFKGKYGAALLNKLDQAIKGASGVNQAFVLRSFGFGRGTSYYESLKAQQQGALGTDKSGVTNLQKVIENFSREGYTGQMGNIALSKFFNISLDAVEKLKAIKLDTSMSAKDKEDKIKGILRKEEEAKMPMLQVEAYLAMKNFGLVAKTLSTTFNKFAESAKTFFAIKEAMNQMQRAMMSLLTPILALVARFLPRIANLIDAIVKSISAFGSAYSKASAGVTGMGKITAGFGAMGESFTQTRKMQALEEKLKTDPKLREKVLLAQKRLASEQAGSPFQSAKFNVDGSVIKLSKETVDQLAEGIKTAQVLAEASKPKKEEPPRPAAAVKDKKQKKK